MKLTQEHNLCIDIGNTRFKAAIFIDDEIIDKKVFYEKDLESHLEAFTKLYSIKSIIVSTTRKSIPFKLIEFGKKWNIHFLELGHDTKLPISIKYNTPTTLGKDRIAAAVGANHIFPNESCIIVDAGTCVTYDYLDLEGNYHGGNIAPGIHMRLEAMHHFTANLPLAPFSIPTGPIGKSTDEALQNGAIKGTIYEIDSFIRQIEKKYGDCRVILTGGDAIYFVDYFKSKIFVVQNLVLIGLNKIIKHNAQ